MFFSVTVPPRVTSSYRLWTTLSEVGLGTKQSPLTEDLLV